MNVYTMVEKIVSVKSVDVNYDGNYLLYDSKRRIHFRSGTAEVGMKRRWKEYINASMKTQHINRSSRLYSSYPHLEYDDVNMTCQDVIMGNFQQIEQLIEIGVARKNLTLINNLLDWSGEEIKRLPHLKGMIL